VLTGLSPMVASIWFTASSSVVGVKAIGVLTPKKRGRLSRRKDDPDVAQFNARVDS
jgi:hypothetical protein